MPLSGMHYLLLPRASIDTEIKLYRQRDAHPRVCPHRLLAQPQEWVFQDPKATPISRGLPPKGLCSFLSCTESSPSTQPGSVNPSSGHSLLSKHQPLLSFSSLLGNFTPSLVEPDFPNKRYMAKPGNDAKGERACPWSIILKTHWAWESLQVPFPHTS